MKLSKGRLLSLIAFFAFGVHFGCATPKNWTSKPVIQTTDNPTFSAKIEPLKMDNPFYVSFRLLVVNNTGENWEIDWNRTRYIFNGRMYGGFVFKGIDPEDIKNKTIPHDILPGTGTFEKVIFPTKLLARAPLRPKSQSAGGAAISPGMLPTGENGIMLVVKKGSKEIVERMTLTIEEK